MTPAAIYERLRAFLGNSLMELVQLEARRARNHLREVRARHPGASRRELAQALIANKKTAAGRMGGVSGVFGAASIPADLAGVLYLQLSLMVEIALAFKVNLKSERARKEVLELFAYASGIGPIQRAGPIVVARIAAVALERGGLKSLGRAVPLLAVPLAAHLNREHMQRMGDEAIRHFDGFARARAKSENASSA